MQHQFVCTYLDKPLVNDPKPLIQPTFLKSYNYTPTMVRHGLCCGIVPEYYLRGGAPGIQAFHLSGLPDGHFFAAYPQDIYLSIPMRRLVELCGEAYQGQVDSRIRPGKMEKEL